VARRKRKDINKVLLFFSDSHFEELGEKLGGKFFKKFVQ
jgi:hypothetical protein